MTGRRLIFHPGVETDLTAILDYYGERDPALPGRFLARLAEQFDRLEMFPESGAFLFEAFRRVVLKRFLIWSCICSKGTRFSCWQW